MTTRGRFTRFFTLLTLLGGCNAAFAAGVVGAGTPASCTPAALVQALAGGGTVTFDCGAAPHTIVVPQRQTIAADTTIMGGNRITLSGGGLRGVLTVQSGRTLVLDHVAIRDGAIENWAVYVSDDATLEARGVRVEQCLRGGIYNAGGTVTVTDSAFVGNDASAAGAAITNEGDGVLAVERTGFQSNLNGAIYSGSTATIVDAIFNDNLGDSAGGGAIHSTDVMRVARSSFVRNKAAGGGAIYGSGDLVVEDSVFRSNEATVFDGGAIMLFNQTQTPSSVTVRASTFTENVAERAGGAVRCDAPEGTCTLENVTLSRNAAEDGSASELSVKSGVVQALHTTVLSGGVVAVERLGGTLTLRNSVVDDGSCAGTITNAGGNVQGAPDLCAAGFATGDPALFALSTNGGWTTTHEIGTSSAALAAAPDGCLPTDQRGVARSATSCDAGAFERGAVPTLLSLDPERTEAGGPAFTLVVHGASFLGGAFPTQAYWNGQPLPTTVTSPTTLAVAVPSALIAEIGVAMITVENPNPPIPDGGPAHDALPFAIDAFIPPPPPPPPPPPAGPCDGLTSWDAVLCAIDQARLPEHFCAAADLDPKLDKALQKALGKAATFVGTGRDAAAKKQPKLLRKARAQLTKIARKAQSKKAGKTTAACQTAVADGTNALAASVAGLGQ
jgi:predicted outer membrane repeat protein